MNAKLSPEALDALTQPTQPTLLAEYRSGVATSNAYRDRDGRSRTLVRATHQVEIGTVAIALEELLDDTLDPAKWQPPAPKGTLVLIALNISRASSPGTWRIRVENIRPASGSSVK